MKKSFLMFALLSAASFLWAAPPVLDFEDQTPAWKAENSTASLSRLRWKTGKQSLLWQWQKSGAELQLSFPETVLADQNRKKPAFAAWIYLEKPLAGRLQVELRCKGKIVAKRFWYNLNFQGWCPIQADYRTLKISAREKIDSITLTMFPKQGKIYLDFVQPLAYGQHIAADEIQPWANDESILKLSARATLYSPSEIAYNRPWLPRLIRENEIPEADRKDLETVTARFRAGAALPPRHQNLTIAQCREKVRAFGIAEKNGIITGRPLGFNLPGAVHVKTEFGQLIRSLAGLTRSKDAAVSREAFALGELCIRYFLDQGYQWGCGPAVNAIQDLFYEYPEFAHAMMCFLNNMKDPVLLETAARSMVWYGNGYLAVREKFEVSTDDIYLYSRFLGRAIAMVPSAAKRYQYYKMMQRFLNIAICNDLPFGVDGTIHHHWGHHIAYGGYTPPLFTRTQISPLAGSCFFISKEAHERLRTYARALDFQCIRGKVVPNIPLRAGVMTDLSPVDITRELAKFGTPDGSETIDSEMAGIYLYHQQNAGDKDAITFRNAGLEPRKPIGHRVYNWTVMNIHRYGDLQAVAVGMFEPRRGFENYGWLESNNYGRYSRFGTLFLSVNHESGWRHEGWNHNFWPGGTNPVRPEADLFEGYSFAANNNRTAGGSTMDDVGIWGMKFQERDVKFERSAFFSGGKILSITTGIQDIKTPDLNIVTTIFQQALLPESTPVINGEPVSGDKEWSSDGKSTVFLVDNLGIGYCIFPGSPVHFRRGEQSWTYFYKRHLVDPSDNPAIDVRSKKFRETPLAANARYYQPTTGTYSRAWVDHGKEPSNASCIYVAIPGATTEQLKTYADKPTLQILQANADAHVIHDQESGITGYAVFNHAKPLPGVIRQVSAPGFYMVKDHAVTLGNTNPDLNGKPIRILFRNGSTKTITASFPLLVSSL
ncbi:MAG: hypothetical protein J6R85_01385 [Lentisphaeria bacterium]|nr:hypothetical protein [Lentisphaeria bacterium]